MCTDEEGHRWRQVWHIQGCQLEGRRIIRLLRGGEVQSGVRRAEEMFATGFISCKLDPSRFSPDDEDYLALPLKDKKRILMDLLDLNQLYVNYCDMDDKTFKISAADKAFTKSFYEGK